MSSEGNPGNGGGALLVLGGACAAVIVGPLLLLLLVLMVASGGAAASVPISGDKQQIAAGLIASGKLRTLPGNPDHIAEIRNIAAGTPSANCDIDVRILQVLALLVAKYDSVGVSDINRKCTGQIEGAGTSSAHWIEGGGHAVDLWAINGHAIDGGDATSVEILRYLDPHMPAGSRAGQGQGSCRGQTPGLTGFTVQFSDTCNHLHLDVAFAKGGVR